MTDAPPPGPIIVTVALAPADQRWADALRRAHFPPERNLVPAHVTLFHHLPPARMAELDRLLAALVDDAPPTARLLPPRSLGRGVAFDIDAPGVLMLRDRIAETFAADLIPQDRARPRLHLTVQNKVDPATARATLATLSEDYVPRMLTVIGIATWAYRGGPWDALRLHRFRRSAGRVAHGVDRAARRG